MTPEASALIDRIRPLLPDQPIREVKMFGAVAVMVADAMVVAVNKDGSLLVRVDPEEDAQLLRAPDASRAEMGKGRDMGIGWLRIDPHLDASRLEHWVDAALRYREREGYATP